MGTGSDKANPVAAATAGSLAGAASKTVVAPIERVRLLLQMSASRSSSSAGLNAVLQQEGTAGLWRGNGLAVARAMLQKGTLFATQDSLSRTTGSHTLGGGVAGMTAAGITYPLDLLRTRLAGQVGTESLSALARESIVNHGIFSLWRGASATLAGGVVFESVRFGVYGWLREKAGPTGEPLLGPAVAGTIASLLAGNLIYPNDTVRRRLQTVVGSRETYWQATQALIGEGGVPRLYRGFLLYQLKAAPSAAVQFYTYHELKKLVTRAQERRGQTTTALSAMQRHNTSAD